MFQRVGFHFLTIDSDATEFDLWVVCCGVKGHQGERTSFVVPPNQAIRFYDGVGVMVGQTRAFKFVKVVSLLAFGNP